MREELLTQMTEGDGDTEFVQLKKRRARKRKRNVKKFEELNDVGSDIPLVHDEALTGCLPMGCHSCKKYGGLRRVNRDDDTGNAQLHQSFCNDGRRQLSELFVFSTHPLFLILMYVGLPRILMRLLMPLIIIVITHVFSHWWNLVMAAAMHNCVNHLLMITDADC